jgi:NADPH:quinone reductase-like Zn-dependent oxidoreductase
MSPRSSVSYRCLNRFLCVLAISQVTAQPKGKIKMSSEPFVRDHPMSFDLELNHRRTLVTGGTKGIGAAVVDVLREAGAAVLAAARSVPDKSPEAVRYIAADLSTAEGCAAVARSVFEQLTSQSPWLSK